MTRWWNGAHVATSITLAGAPVRILATAVGDDDQTPLRLLHVEVPDGAPITIDLPPGTQKLTLQTTTDDPRDRVARAQHRRRARPSWSIRWRR